jgi:hypothetical protein
MKSKNGLRLLASTYAYQVIGNSRSGKSRWYTSLGSSFELRYNLSLTSWQGPGDLFLVPTGWPRTQLPTTRLGVAYVPCTLPRDDGQSDRIPSREGGGLGLIDRLRSVFRKAVTPSAPSPLARPPADWRDVDGWNAYWQTNIEQTRPDLLLVFDIRPVDAVLVPRDLERLMRRKRTSVLVVGNGITLIPRMFCHAGFQTVALDISSVATEFARRYEPTREDWRLLFQLDGKGAVGDFVKDFARPGGTVEYICGDLFEQDVTPGPFDVIWSSRSLQGFNDEDLELAIGRLDARLHSNGECHVLVQNSADKYKHIVGVFERLGYAINPDNERPGKALHIGIGSG